MARRRLQTWGDLRRHWPELTAYQRFETFVATLLTIIDVLRALNPLTPQVFQTASARY